jgi:serine/threonine protein kinase
LIADRYKVIRKLGSGGFGAVYLVNDAHLSGKLCAMKEMTDTKIPDPVEKQQAIQAFQKEAFLLAALNHPNLTKVIDCFQYLGKHYLVMDYVDGQALDDMLDVRATPFPEAKVVEWAEQLCDVLDYLHHQSPPVIFRDLKPGNIMLNKEGQIRLIDFGVARLFKPGVNKRDTVFLGTPGYAPPEQYEKLGKGQSDPRSDVYALGATLHQLLTKRNPGDDPFNFPPIISLNTMVSKRVSDAIQKAVNVSPDLRWQSTADFAQALIQPGGSAAFMLPGANVPAAKVPQTPVRMPAVIPTVIQTPAILPVPAVRQAPSPIAAPPQYPARVQHVADNTHRFYAYLIDSLITAGFSFLLFLLFANSGSEDGLYAFIILLSLSFLAYYTGFHAASGQTPGKKRQKLKVVCKNGEKLGWKRALWRTVCYLLVPVLISVIFADYPVGGLILLGLVFLWPLFTKDHRALHDIFAGTRVIKA